jgi:hypothetical protein
MSTYEGLWVTNRRILDFASGRLWTFTGSTQVTSTAFAEHGLLDLSGTTAPASRSYLLGPGPRGGVDVRTADGSSFVTLTTAPWQVVGHVCGLDTYAGLFVFRDLDLWIEVWRVRGPRKNYRSFTRHERASS